MTHVDMNDFVALILTNGRPDRVRTYKTLRDCGYTGEIRLVVDDLDATLPQYVEKYGKEVVVFDKKKTAATFDNGDNFNDMRAIIYARNASFDVAESEGFKYFIQLDDDYTVFHWRFGAGFEYLPPTPKVRSLDVVFYHLLNYYVSTPAHSLAIAQGGDFIGGYQSRAASAVRLSRKCMNSFICSTERRFQFIGRINEDVNTYTRGASTGLLLFTTNQISLGQMRTQSNAGGMTELYIDSGTYVKSFYSVMYQPSSVTIRPMGDAERRLHHSVDWNRTVPKILSEDLRKPLAKSKKK